MVEYVIKTKYKKYVILGHLVYVLFGFRYLKKSKSTIVRVHNIMSNGLNIAVPMSDNVQNFLKHIQKTHYRAIMNILDIFSRAILRREKTLITK
jgi:hypothetical protein